jgi:hypothetical protein
VEIWNSNIFPLCSQQRRLFFRGEGNNANLFSALLFTTRVRDRHYGQQREKTHEMIGVVGNNLELFSSVVEPVPLEEEPKLLAGDRAGASI